MSHSMTRRDLVKGAAAAAALPAVQALAAPAKKGATKKKALFIYGGWDGHEPVKCKDRFVPWLQKEGFEVTAADSLAPYTDAALMKSLDLIIQIWTMGKIEKDQLKGLLTAVKENGTGLAGWHGGLGDAFRQETEYEYMVGGNWVAHPGGKIDYTVNIVDHEDPITYGLGDFKLHSEQYFMHTNPNNKVLATTTFAGDHDKWIEACTMPVVWKKVYGKGRVFYTSMGHSNDVFDTPEAFEITKRGILWASESKYQPTPNLVTPVYPSR